MQGRRYQTRKAITVPMAAAITGLSESTIKRLDKDPKNTSYPGRNSTAKILAAWGRCTGATGSSPDGGTQVRESLEFPFPFKVRPDEP